MQNILAEAAATQPTAIFMNGYQLTLAIAAVGFITIVIGITAFVRVKGSINSDMMFRVFAFALLVAALLIMIALGVASGAGFTAVVGLLGSVIGYTIGKPPTEPGHKP